MVSSGWETDGWQSWSTEGSGEPVSLVWRIAFREQQEVLLGLGQDQTPAAKGQTLRAVGKASVLMVP